MLTGESAPVAKGMKAHPLKVERTRNCNLATRARRTIRLLFSLSTDVRSPALD
jgi:hypothetical protein